MSTGKSTISRFIAGGSSFFRGFNFINEHSLWRYIILPSIISLVLGVGLVFLVYFNLTDWVLSYFEGNAEETGFLGFLSGVLQFFVHIMAVVIGVVITVFLYRTLATLLVLPFLGPLLEQVEKILTGKAVTLTWDREIKNALVGVWVGIKYFLIEILFLLISLFTGPLQPVIMGFISGYFLGRGSYDYLLEKHSASLKERKERAKAYKAEMQGLGIIHFIALLVPVIGVIIAPPSALVGAALTFYDE